MTEQPDLKEIHARIEATLDIVGEVFAHANAALGRIWKLWHELDDSRQLHRAITERKAEQSPRPDRDHIPAPQASDSLPEATLVAEPPIKNGSASP